MGWERWIESDWYGEIIEYKLTGKLIHRTGDGLSRSVKRKVTMFVLIEAQPNELAY